MIDTSKYSDKIQKYLANELSSSELAEFEDLIKSDLELQDEIRLYRKVSDSLSDPSLENFKNELEMIHKEQYGSQTNYVKHIRPWYLVAASILVLITIGSLHLFQSGNVNLQDMFNKYYAPIETNVSRSLNDEADVFNKGIEAYTSGNYNLALSYFNEAIQLDNTNMAAHLYSGICGIELENIDLAKNQFETIIKMDDPFYVQEAEWYMALILLRTEEIKTATSQLMSIIDRGGVYAEKASSILAEL